MKFLKPKIENEFLASFVEGLNKMSAFKPQKHPETTLINHMRLILIKRLILNAYEVSEDLTLCQTVVKNLNRYFQPEAKLALQIFKDAIKSVSTTTFEIKESIIFKNL